MRDIGKNIRQLRTEMNMTQDELARKLFVTRQTVSNYEMAPRFSETISNNGRPRICGRPFPFSGSSCSGFPACCSGCRSCSAGYSESCSACSWIDPPNVFCGKAVKLVCAGFQALSFALKIRPTRSPAKMAMVMPPAVAFSPPVKIPRNPCRSMASFTPLARV